MWTIRWRECLQPQKEAWATQEKVNGQNTVGGSLNLGNESSLKVGSKWRKLNHECENYREDMSRQLRKTALHEWNHLKGGVGDRLREILDHQPTWKHPEKTENKTRITNKTLLILQTFLATVFFLHLQQIHNNSVSLPYLLFSQITPSGFVKITNGFYTAKPSS